MKYFVMLLLCISQTSYASCHGRFINPITDICWSCILPISIGGFNIGKGNTPSKRDTKNPSSPICLCTKNNIPIPGIAVGFWEPVRLVDVTQTPYCMTLLGGLKLGNDFKKTGSWQKSYETNAHDKHSFYQLHYYIYPIIYWLELLTDFACLEKSTFDVGYMSEFDVTWNDEKLQNLLNPESFLFANPIAQSASALDCASATLDFAQDNLFWCAGCYGNLYPLSGYNANHSSGVQTSSLLTTRILAKLHKIGLAKETSTSDSSVNGRLCKKVTNLKLKKSQYKLQMLYPKSTQCWPLGYSDMLYSPYKEYPNDGQDFGYLVYRKVNCCAL